MYKEAYYLLADHLPITLTLWGAPLALCEGETRYENGTISTDCTYTGQYSNTDDFGWMYYKARWYDAALGRFTQADSIVPNPYLPIAYDRYAYANNSPITNNDRSGHCVFGLDTTACIAIALGILKAVDWGWTAYDAYASANVIASETSSDSEKILAGLNITLAAGFEAMEPDDASPVSLPADDLVRLGVMKGAREALEEGGEEGLRKFLKDTLGDQADDVINKMLSSKNATKLSDGMKMSANDALDAAEEFLGKGYQDLGDGRFISADGLRQVRMGDKALLGKHSGGSHMNFETLKVNPKDPTRRMIISNVHIFLE